MGLFDLFSSIGTCPHCFETNAKLFLWMVKCRNRVCDHFSAEWHDVYEGLMRVEGPTVPPQSSDSDPRGEQ